MKNKSKNANIYKSEFDTHNTIDEGVDVGDKIVSSEHRLRVKYQHRNDIFEKSHNSDSLKSFFKEVFVEDYSAFHNTIANHGDGATIKILETEKLIVLYAPKHGSQFLENALSTNEYLIDKKSKLLSQQ